MKSEDIFGLLSVGISLAAFANYIITVLKNKTKPHALTWAIWSLILGIIFVAQWNKGAGAGAWSTGTSAFLCLTIFLLALFKGEKNITRSDWTALVCALIIIPFWHFTRDTLSAVVLATLIDAFAYFPTVRKTWIKPHEENPFMYASDIAKWMLAFFAMSEYSVTALIYPIFCIAANSSLALMIFWRRRQLARMAH